MSGEIQHLSTEAEVHPLMRTRGGLVLSSEGRQLQAGLRRAMANGVEKKANLAIARDIALEAMEAAKDVDDRRQALAGRDQGLNAALTEIELAFLSDVNRIQRGRAF